MSVWPNGSAAFDFANSCQWSVDNFIIIISSAFIVHFDSGIYDNDITVFHCFLLNTRERWKPWNRSQMIGSIFQAFYAK